MGVCVPQPKCIAQSTTVPSAYQDLYASLQTDIADFTQSLPAAVSPSTFYSAQLLSASSENGSGLLNADTENRVRTELQELEALGLKAVTVHINFPDLYSPYYSNQSTYQSMLGFYEWLATEVRGRGLQLIVETQVSKPSPIAPNTSQVSYLQSLSWTAYVAGRAQTAATIVQYVKPDYLTVISEPDTEATASGQSRAHTVAGSLQLLQSIVSAVGSAGTKLGAGVGSWDSSLVPLMTAYAAQRVQYLDVHVYPVSRNFLQNAVTAANIAHSAGKPIAMTEAWLQKVRDSELASLSADVSDQRNNYSFFEPLDLLFLQAMVKLANAEQFVFVSPFWSNYFFKYLDYSDPAASSVSQALIQAAQANQVGQFSPVGTAFETAILPSPDRTSPAVPAPPAVTRTAGAPVHLAWQPSSDNVGVAGYQIARNGKLIGVTSSAAFNDSSAPKTGALSYNLIAFDAAGNVSPHSSAGVAP